MYHVEFLIMYKDAAVGARIRDTVTGRWELVPKSEYARYADAEFSNAKYSFSLRSGAVISGKGNGRKLKQVLAENMKPQELMSIGVDPKISKHYRKPVTPPVQGSPKSKKMRGSDALNVDMSILPFEILADMVISLQQSKYKRAFLLKGGFVLMSAVKQKGKTEYLRGTTDLDLDFYSLDSWETFVSELCGILTTGSQRGLSYVQSYRRGVNEEHRSDKLHIDALKNGEKLATVGIDMNVKILLSGVEYKIPELTFTGAGSYSMLVDKLAVASTNELLRRNKDMIDLFIISKIFSLRMSSILNTRDKKKREITAPPFILDGNNIAALKHGYTKQGIGAGMGLIFEDVYRGVIDFVTLIYQAVSSGLNYDPVWDCERGVWRNEGV